VRSIWLGWDPREQEAFHVCRYSIRQRMKKTIPVYSLVLEQLRNSRLYYRPTEYKADGRMWDVISNAPMATEFAISRFLIGHLARHGYAMFLDCDMLIRGDLSKVFEICEADPSKAVWCVKHRHEPREAIKMGGEIQTTYARKNWSSLMVLNVSHPSNASLTVEMVNQIVGRDLHHFCWLADHEIGELGPTWNWLEGYSEPIVNPKVVHFTSGGPWMPGFENVAYADEWRAERDKWKTDGTWQ
jgi:lipopolysaccharide biosynthesis glycosyltransferase